MSVCSRTSEYVVVLISLKQSKKKTVTKKYGDIFIKNKTLVKFFIKASQLSCPFLTKHIIEYFQCKCTIMLSSNKCFFLTKSMKWAKLQLYYLSICLYSKNRMLQRLLEVTQFYTTLFIWKQKLMVIVYSITQLLCMIMRLNFSQLDVRKSDVFNFLSLLLKGKSMCLPPFSLNLLPGIWMWWWAILVHTGNGNTWGMVG